MHLSTNTSAVMVHRRPGARRFRAGAIAFDYRSTLTLAISFRPERHNELVKRISIETINI